MEALLRDLAHGWRLLTQKPMFTLLVVLTLGLGIGANSAVFSVVNAVVLRPLPYRDASQLVVPWGNAPQLGFDQIPQSIPNYVDLRDQATSFSGFAVFNPVKMNLTGGGDPEQIPAASVSANLFGVLGVEPARGRGFLAGEDKPGAGKVVVLSDGMWKRRFDSDPGVVGRIIRLDEESYTVVGIMPQRFQFPPDFTAVGARVSPAEVWVPLPLEVDPAARGNFFLFPLARLKPGVGVGQAQAEMASIAKRLAEAHPDSNTGIGANVVSLRDQVLSQVRVMLFILLGAVSFVLLIACANVANLLLAQALAREREFVICNALGADRRRMMWQLVREGLPLGLLGAAVGLLFAQLGIRLLLAVSPGDIPRLSETSIDVNVLGFTLIVAILVTFLFNLVPAARAARADLGAALREGGRSSVAGASSFLRKTLGVIEIALALVLLIGAGLMVRSLFGLTRVELGFEPKHVLSFELTPPPTKYAAAQVPAFYQRLLERLRTLPGVVSAGGSSLLPLGGADASTGFFVEGKPDDPGEPRQLHYRSTTSGYFDSLGIKLLRGRDFSDRDLSTSPGVIIVNEALARRYWPGEDPIGKRLAIDFEVDAKNGDRAAAWRQVVGVAADVKHGGLDADASPEGFLPFSQSVERTMSLVVRSQGDPALLVGPVRAAVAEIDRDLPISKIAPMESLVSLSVSQPRFNMLLFVIFAALAVILGAVGIYGVMSQLVAEQNREIGIRMSLGALPSDVLRVVARQGLKLTVIGLAIGLGASVALSRVLTSLLFQVSATDTLTLLAASFLVAAAVALACIVPARRAMSVEPMTVLKYG